MTTATLTTDAKGQMTLQGHLDADSVVALLKQGEQCIDDQSIDTIYIDLQGVTHANSAGVALLVNWLRHAKRQAKSLRFTHVPAQVASIIQLSGLEQVLQIEAIE